MTALAVMAGVVGVAACIDDLSRRQISNWISCSAFAERRGSADCSARLAWRGIGVAWARWREPGCFWFFICWVAWVAET